MVGAVWVFAPPHALPAVDSYLERTKGQKLCDKVELTLEEMSDMCEDSELAQLGVCKVQQRAGEVVFVPPGWVHWVKNEQACVKFAYDGYDPKLMFAYMQSWEQVASKFTNKSNAPDYMGLHDALVHIAAEYSSVVASRS